MGILIRQSIATTVIAYAGVVIGYVNLLYLYPRFLTPEQVGVMRTVQDAAILMAQFAQFGLAQSIIRFFPRFMNQGRALMNLVLLAALVAYGLFLIVFFSFEDKILGYFRDNAADLIHYTALVLWMTFITVITTLLEVYARSLLKNILPNLLKEVVSRLSLAGLVLCYFMGYLSFPQLMVGSILIYAVLLLILALSLGWQGHLGTGLALDIKDKALRRDLITFSLLSFAGTAGLIIIGKVDSMMVAGLLGLAPVAVYTTSFYMATVIEVPKRAMTQVATPLIARSMEKEDHKEVQKIYRETALHQFILGALLFTGVVANLDSIFLLMPRGEIYQTGKWVVIIVGAGKLIDMLFGPNSEIIIYSKYYKFNIALIVLLAILIVTLNNLFIPRYGIEGAALGAAITLAFFNLAKFVFIRLVTGLHPFTSAFLKVALMALAAWLVQLLVPRLGHPLVDMIVRSALMTLVYGIAILKSGVSPQAITLIRQVLALLKLRKNQD